MNLEQAATPEDLNEHSLNSCAHHCGVQVERIGTAFVEASMPYDERTRSANGALRLGALSILAESVGNLAATIAIDRSKYTCVGQSLEVHHLTTACSGPVRARAVSIRVTSSMHLWQINITDAQPELIVTAQLSMAVLERSKRRRSDASIEMLCGSRAGHDH